MSYREFIMNNYMDMNGVEIARALGWFDGKGRPDKNKVQKVRKEMGLEVRGVTTSYFKNIDSPEKAYMLGFIVGDGGINRNGSGLIIGVKRSDRSLLEKFQNILRSNGVICSIKDYDSTNSSQLIIRSKCEVEYLAELGVFPAKSKVGTDRVNLPVGNEYHFLRGLMDSDGCIPKNNSQSILIRFMQSPQSKAILERADEFLRKEGFGTQFSVGRLAVLSISGHYAKALGERIYRDSELRLERKYEVFQKMNHELEGPNWYEIGQMLDTFEGMTYKDIAEKLGFSHSTIRQGFIREFGYSVDRQEICRRTIRNRQRDDKGRFV